MDCFFPSSSCTELWKMYWSNHKRQQSYVVTGSSFFSSCYWCNAKQMNFTIKNARPKTPANIFCHKSFWRLCDTSGKMPWNSTQKQRPTKTKPTTTHNSHKTNISRHGRKMHTESEAKEREKNETLNCNKKPFELNSLREVERQTAPAPKLNV